MIAAHPTLRERGLFYRGLSPVRTLLVDHTLSFPRVSWTFTGYSWTTIVMATVVLYLAYILIEAGTWVTSSLLVVHPSAKRLWTGWWVIPLMPAYRYLVFWMRFSGTLTVLTEPHQWRTTDPVTATGMYLVSPFRRESKEDEIAA